MAITTVKAQKISTTALALLQRELILPSLVWTDLTKVADWNGAKNDTVTIRIPARTQARTRTLRGTRGAANAPSEGTGIIVMDDLGETSLDVKIDEAIYKAVPTTDEEETLDIYSYGEQILTPMVRAVAEGAENKLADEMVSATYANTATIDPVVDPATNPSGVLGGLYRARRFLNDANVPMNDRIVVCGSAIEEVLLNSDKLHEADKSGTDSALRDATIGRVAGFGRIVVSNALPEDFGVAFHRTAFTAMLVAPKIPEGAAAGNRVALGGVGMRWIKDYDFRQAQDRSMVDVYMGVGHISDGADGADVDTDPDFVRAVKLELAS